MSSRKRTLDISNSSASSSTSSSTVHSNADKKHKKMNGSNIGKKSTPLIDKIFEADANLLNGNTFSKKYYDILKQRRRLPVYDFKGWLAA